MITIHLTMTFLAKVMDNVLGTTKTILVQRNKPVLAGASLALSCYISYWITRIVVTADGNLAMAVASVGSGVGCCLALLASNRFSRDRTYVNVILSDNKAAMQDCRISGTFLPGIISPM